MTRTLNQTVKGNVGKCRPAILQVKWKLADHYAQSMFQFSLGENTLQSSAPTTHCQATSLSLFSNLIWIWLSSYNVLDSAICWPVPQPMQLPTKFLCWKNHPALEIHHNWTKSTCSHFVWMLTPFSRLQGVTGGVKNHALLSISPILFHHTPQKQPSIHTFAIYLHHCHHYTHILISSTLYIHEFSVSEKNSLWKFLWCLAQVVFKDSSWGRFICCKR